MHYGRGRDVLTLLFVRAVEITCRCISIYLYTLLILFVLYLALLYRCGVAMSRVLAKERDRCSLNGQCGRGSSRILPLRPVHNEHHARLRIELRQYDPYARATLKGD
jgi:hypothetical protein